MLGKVIWPVMYEEVGISIIFGLFPFFHLSKLLRPLCSVLTVWATVVVVGAAVVVATADDPELDPELELDTVSLLDKEFSNWLVIKVKAPPLMIPKPKLEVEVVEGMNEVDTKLVRMTPTKIAKAPKA